MPSFRLCDIKFLEKRDDIWMPELCDDNHGMLDATGRLRFVLCVLGNQLVESKRGLACDVGMEIQGRVDRVVRD